MESIGRLTIAPPLLNSSSAWASEFEQLLELYECKYTGAVTTRTATLNGFQEDLAFHTLAFTSPAISSVNSYGYSPHPLSQYLTWIDMLLKHQSTNLKPIIISITSSSPEEINMMIDSIQALRHKLSDDKASYSRIAVEINTSCPNIAGSPPPAYDVAALAPLLEVLVVQFDRDPSLMIGLKLPPFVTTTQMLNLVNAFEKLALENDECPIAFLACTNTLGMSLAFADQVDGERGGDPAPSPFALPSPLGGLAGDALHPIALGNVYTFSNALLASKYKSVRNISIIGVGGVTSPAAVKRMRDVGAKAVACATIFGKLGIGAFEMLSK